ncbi:2-oxo acid dehydrogenase subunit E2 [Brevibacillus humidisoli]|uniref:dihydrolipoamide acetyltransferase family protein n=1 Tax=Brevibacillus humidisoli TaxID=2895522 RepID=UPI001E328A7E|nr:dihydrolipoamide acetyltransferase family protein [Brevibacillus humidisoli]UFJ40869.1 2-oxo acid dehydrogenase subunit E2 [Brevibacillus humidisoli]
MAHLITMPKFGLTMTEGTVSHWCKSVGERVEAGEVLYEVQTEKISNEVEAPAAGILRHIFAEAGATLEVGAPLAVIAAESEDISQLLSGTPGMENDAAAQHAAPAAAEGATAGAVAEATSTASETLATSGSSDSSRSAERILRATPFARKLAREQGFSLQTIAGTGPAGIVVARDVQAHSEATPSISPMARKWAEEHGVAWEQLDVRGRIMLPDVIAAHLGAGSETDGVNGSKGYSRMEGMAAGVDSAPVASTPMKGMRKVIAERMTASWQQIPHVTLTREIDVTELLAAIKRLQPDAAQIGFKLTLTHFLIKLTAAALGRHPELNAWCDGQTITPHQEVNIGVAVSVPGGLLVPVIRQANRKDLGAIAQTLGDLSVRAREQRLSAEEIQGGTFTISNLGMMGVDGFTPIINPPETGILGVGRVVDKPLFVGDQLEKRSVAMFSLSFDHRALDGAEAAAFLQTLDFYIQEPMRLLVQGGEVR